MKTNKTKVFLSEYNKYFVPGQGVFSRFNIPEDAKKIIFKKKNIDGKMEYFMVANVSMHRGVCYGEKVEISKETYHFYQPYSAFWSHNGMRLRLA